MIRKILAVLAGTVVAVVSIAAMQTVGHQLYPLPADIDFSDPRVLDSVMFDAPPGALLLVIASYIAGTIVGGLAASLIARSSTYVYTAIIGTLMTIGTLINVTSIPHPLWFSVTAIVGIIASIFIASRLADAMLGLNEQPTERR